VSVYYCSTFRDREEEVVLAAVQEEVLSESKEKRQSEKVEGQWRRGGGALKFKYLECTGKG
jgi:hypothetical protein